MARIRSIKPEFFRSRKLSECSVRTRLTFIGLWTACDDEGRYRYEPELLKADLWPFEAEVTAEDVEADTWELAKRALVCLYEVAGKRHLHVVNWHEHQKINRPSPSRLPECSRSTHGGFPEDSSPRARAQEVELGTEEKEQGSKTVVEQARPIDDVTHVFRTWQEATRKHRAQLDPKRRRRIKAVLQQYPLQDVLDAVQGWQHSPHHCGQNNTGTVYNDLDLLLRDAEHLERFRDLWRDGPAPVVSKQTAQAMRTSVAMRTKAQEGVMDRDLRGVGRSGGPAECGLPASAD